MVFLSYGKLGTLDEELLRSIRLVGEVTGNQQRAAEVIDFMRTCQQDLGDRTKDIPEADKPSVYVGGLVMKGTHGIESTQAKYPPLTASNANNVADEMGSEVSVTIDKEKLMVWDPDTVFIDESGLSMVKEDYDKNPGFSSSLKAVKDGAVYGFLPYNYYTTNLDTALADAYFMRKTIFPDAFKDIDPAKKADEIYLFLLGKKLYAQMAKDFGGLVRLDLASL